MSTVNLKNMLVDKFVMDADNEKAQLRQVDLKVGKGVRTCYVVSKKKNIVQIKSIFSDDTVEELEIEFVQNSLKMIGVKAYTYLYKGGMDLQTISEKEIVTIDLNKYAVVVGDLYVPVNVILTPYFKEKANNVVFAGAIKSLELVDENRIETLDDNSKEIKLHTVLDLNVLDEDGKAVDVTSLSNKNLKALSKINNNSTYMRILSGEYNTDETVKGASKNQNVVNTFDELGFIKDCASRMEDYKTMDNKSEIEITAFLVSKMSKEECELLISNKMFRQAVMLETTDKNTTEIDPTILGNGIFEVQGISSLTQENKMDLVMDLLIMKNKDKIKDMDNFKAQVKLLIETEKEENTNQDDVIDGGESKMENVIDEINNDVVILNSVEKRLEAIKDKYKSLVTSDQLKSIISISLVMGEKGFNKIENEQVFKTMFGLKNNDETVNNKEAAIVLAQTLQSILDFNSFNADELNNEDGITKYLTIAKITDSIDSVINKEEFLKNVIEIISKINTEEIEKVEAEVVNSVSKQENVVNNKSKKNNTNEIVVSKNTNTVTNNKVYVNMVKYICNTLGDEGLVKYNNELTMIHDKLGKESLSNIAKNNKRVNEILTRYTRTEINECIVKGFEVVGELLNTLKNNVHGYEEIGTLIKLPLDIKVKLVYLLLEKDDVTIEDMSIEDRALFYIVLRSSLDVSVDDMRQGNSSGDFTLARARVSVRNREIVKNHIA